MKHWINKRKNNAGMTMVEIIVVLVILAILAAFTIPTLSGFIADANTKDCKARQSDVAKQYINTLVDQSVANPGSTIDTRVLQNDVLGKKGTPLTQENVEALDADAQAILKEKSPNGTYYQGICEKGGVYYARTQLNPDNPEVNDLYVGCTKHGETLVTTGAIRQSPPEPAQPEEEPTIVTLDVEPAPNKTIYETSDTQLDLTGGEALLYYSDGHEARIPLTNGAITCTGFDPKNVGEQTITVHLDGTEVTGSFKITVKAPTVTGLNIKTPPTKTDYALQDIFVPAGCVLELTLSNGTTKEITEPYTSVTFVGQNMNALGKYTVKAVYQAEDSNNQPITSDNSFDIIVENGICRIVHQDATHTYYKNSTPTTIDALTQALAAVQNDETIEMLVADYEIAATQKFERPVVSFTLTTATDVPGLDTTTFKLKEKKNVSMFEINSINANITFERIKLKAPDQGPSDHNGAKGRGVKLTAGNLTLDGVTLSGFVSNLNGGSGVLSDGTGSVLTIKNSTITNCGMNNTGVKERYGGGVAAKNGTLVINGNTLITGCKGNGAAAIFTDQETVEIGEDVQITGNSDPALRSANEINPGGSLIFKESKVTIKDNVKIENNVEEGMNTATITLPGSNSILKLEGDVAITNNRALFGAVSTASGAGTIKVSGNVQITGNTMGDNLARNVYLQDDTTMLFIDGNLGETANIGVTAQERMTYEKQFGITTDEGFTNLAQLKNDELSVLYGVQGDGNKVIWGPIITGVCQIKHNGQDNYIQYDTLQEAVNAADSGVTTTIEMLVPSYSVEKSVNLEANRDITIKPAANIDGRANITCSGYHQALFHIMNPGASMTFINMNISYTGTTLGRVINNSGGGTVVLDNTIVYGGKGYPGGGVYSQKNTSSVTLKNGSKITNCTGGNGSNGEGGDNGHNGAAIYSSGGTITLKDTSEISNCGSSTYDEGGAIYCKSGTINLEGYTMIHNCTAKKNGIVYTESGTINLKGKAAIEDNTVPDGAIVMNYYTWSQPFATLNVQDGVKVTNNRLADGKEANVYLGKYLSWISYKYAKINVTSNLNTQARIGITAEGKMEVGDDFGTTTNPASSVEGLYQLYQDNNGGTVGAAGSDTAIVWQVNDRIGINRLNQWLYDSDSKVYEYFSTGSRKNGGTLDSNGNNFAPEVNQALEDAGINTSGDSWQIKADDKGADTYGYTIYWTVGQVTQEGVNNGTWYPCYRYATTDETYDSTNQVYGNVKAKKKTNTDGTSLIIIDSSTFK